MEFGVFKIPRPDTIIYLDVPLDFARKLLKNKNLSHKKRYTKGKKDRTEYDLTYLQNSYKSAKAIAQNNRRWYTIECVKDNKLLTREEIHEMIYERVSRLVKI